MRDGLQKLMTDKNISISLGLGSAISFGLMSFLVHRTKGSIPPSEVVLFQALLGVVLFFQSALKNLRLLITKAGIPLWIRAIGGSFSVLCLFLNLQASSVGDASALANLAPVFVLLISVLFFHARIRFLEIVSLLLIVAGIEIMSSPVGSSLPTKVLLVGLGGALAASIAYIALKESVGKLGVGLIIWLFYLCTGIVAAVFSIGHWQRPGMSDVLTLLAIGSLSLLGQLLVTKSFVHLSAAIASALSLSSVVWGVLFETLFRREYPGLMGLGSYALILGGVFVLSLRPSQNLQAQIR